MSPNIWGKQQETQVSNPQKSACFQGGLWAEPYLRDEDEAVDRSRAHEDAARGEAKEQVVPSAEETVQQEDGAGHQEDEVDPHHERQGLVDRRGADVVGQAGQVGPVEQQDALQAEDEACLQQGDRRSGDVITAWRSVPS